MATLVQFLTSELKGHGVDHIFGIPGDFIQTLFQRLADSGEFDIVRMSHEPGLGFAAQGAARASQKLAVCCVTYGVGALNSINPIACAYAERVPLLVLTGGPAKKEIESGLLVHHQVKSYGSQFNIFQELTAASFILDNPDKAAEQIRYALSAAEYYLRPVYLQIPRDMVDVEISISKPIASFPIDEDGAYEASGEILDTINRAKNPTLMVGVEVQRMNLCQEVVSFAERSGLPVVSSFLGKSAFPIDHPQYLGSYCGFVSPDKVKDAVDNSDALIMLGVQLTDTNMGVQIKSIPDSHKILAADGELTIKGKRYKNIPLRTVLRKLLSRPELRGVRGLTTTVDDSGNIVSAKREYRENYPKGVFVERAVQSPGGRVGVHGEHFFSPPGTAKEDASTPLLSVLNSKKKITVPAVVDALNRFLSEQVDMPVVVDVGDALFAGYELNARELYLSPYYASMGFAVPTALGIEKVTGRRPIVIVGDGAFQMTGSEVSWAPFYNLKPIIVLLNNAAWEMLKQFGAGSFNDIISWPYAKLANEWGGKGYDVRTEADFNSALIDAKSQNIFSILDVHLEKGDITHTLRNFVEHFQKGR